MRNQIANHPGVTLRELQGHVQRSRRRVDGVPGTEAHESIVKKKSLIAAEQQRPDVVERRHHFTIARRFVPPESLVFLDESGAQSNMTRLRGRSSIGERCHDLCLTELAGSHQKGSWVEGILQGSLYFWIGQFLGGGYNRFSPPIDTSTARFPHHPPDQV